MSSHHHNDNEDNPSTPCHQDDSRTTQSTPAAPLTPLDRYTALRNHRIRFQDALDPNAERVTALHKHDIIFGRGKNMQDHPGNRRMRSIIDKYKQRYYSLHRWQKRDLVEAVYKEITQGGARFLTKAMNDEHLVLVDVEVALQKVSNTLRCRKDWNKVAKIEKEISKEARAPLVIISSPVAQSTSAGTHTAPPTSANPSLATRSIPLASLLILRNRSQTMSLLRENTVRLILQMPLLPFTTNNGVLCLQQCQSLLQYPVQLVQMRAQPKMNDVLKTSISSSVRKAVPKSIETTVESTTRLQENAK